MSTNPTSLRKVSARVAPRRRKGIILLLVVSLLALFLLMGITYALIASSYEQTASTAARINAKGDMPQNEVESALDHVLFGPVATSLSPLSGHDLLGDLYGNDSVKGSINTAAAEVVSSTTPPVWRIVVSTLPDKRLKRFPASDSNNNNFRWNIDNYFSGRLLTFLDSNASYPTCRILGHSVTNIAGGQAGAIHTLYVTTAGYTPQSGVEFLINGAPFNGTGAGYQPLYDSATNTLVNDVNYSNVNDPNLASNTMTDIMTDTNVNSGATFPAALLPNFAGYLQKIRYEMRTRYIDPAHGGLDEDYDAPDYQNMAMALVPPVRSSTADIIPSFHRPELFSYWVNQCQVLLDADSAAAMLTPDQRAHLILCPLTRHPVTNNFIANYGVAFGLRERIHQLTRGSVFRPLPGDHRNFNGSNPLLSIDPFSPTTPELNCFKYLLNLGYQPQGVHNPGGIAPDAIAWDIDNDNDGINDAIWVDIGLPVMTNSVGKRYKRLVAYTIKDMDGRINLNAHGNYSHLNSVAGTSTPLTIPVGLAGAGSTLSRGQGFGPADVDFRFMFDPSINPLMNVAQYTALLSQRYGNDGQAGQAGVRDAWSTVRHPGIPNDFFNGFSGSPSMGSPSMYNSPPDVYGRGVVALDAAGQPVWLNAGLNNEMVDAPYEITPRASFDAPYNLSDLEWLCRYNDVDASTIPSRVGNILQGAPRNVLDSFTVHSSYMPVSGFSAPRGQRADQYLMLASSNQYNTSQTVLTGGNSILELYYAKVAPNIMNNMMITDKEAGIRNVMSAIVPWELKRGQLFDLNRPFGNGVDDNNDGVVDDPSEAFAGETSAANAPFNTMLAQSGDVTFDLNNNGTIEANEQNYARTMARQIYARHLFCLMLVLTDCGYDPLNIGYVPATLNDVDVTSDTQRRELAIRRLAQWAINVVDARDSDSVMTAFEYDVNPFNGWNVDGNVATDENTSGTTNERRVVWGLEAPELLITETMAMHNKRVKDTVYDDDSDMGSHRLTTDNPDSDDHLDQFAIPQGSAFVELYCPRPSQINTSMVPAGTMANPNALGLPREMYFYDSAAGKWRLNIGFAHATPSADGVRHPVYQLAISQDVSRDDATTPRRPSARRSSKPESTSFQPEDMSLVSPTYWPLSTGSAQSMPIERYVWFSNVAPPAGTPLANQVFLNSNGWDVSLEPGQYAVVGPRATTTFGSVDDGDPSTMFDGNSPQAITLQSFVRSNTNQTGVVITDSAGTPNNYLSQPGVAARSTVGIVVDMPGPTTDTSAPFYWTNSRRVGFNISENLPRSANYYDEPNPTNDARVPVDAYTDPMAPMQELEDKPFDEQPGFLLADAMISSPGLKADRRTIFLQRLADPTQPWDATTNPYITVDWSGMDLHVFNGDHDDAGASQALNTVERGRLNSSDLWASTFTTSTNGTPGGGSLYFNYNLGHTLGFLNSIFGTPRGSMDPLGPQVIGDPMNPFPWLTFLNRPFNNPYELMQVSHSSSGRLFHELSLLNPRNFAHRYEARGPVTGTVVDRNYNNHRNPQGLEQESSPFGHLPNFFQSSGTVNNAPHWYRIFDYIETPSPFTDAQEWLNPASFSSVTTPGVWDAFRPPFNWISKYRDPGRININTIQSDNVFYAATRSLPQISQGGPLGQVIASRQGYTGAFQAFDSRFPTRFAGAFTSASTADLAPLQNMRQRGQGGAPGAEGQGIEGTLLRRKLAATPSQEPLLYTQQLEPYRNSDRNSYFQYENYQKVGNIFSKQSNVYAIWVTVGHFEVEDTAVSEACPDGLMLGQELGSDTGELKRSRGFYIIDRSIPAGYIPGRKLNTDNVVLLRRMLE